MIDHITLKCIATLTPFRSMWNVRTSETAKIQLKLTESPPDEFIEVCKKARSSATGYSRETGSPFKSLINEAQYKYIARDVLMFAFPVGSQRELIWKLGHSEVNKGRYQKLSNKIRSGFARTVLEHFYRKSVKTAWWPTLASFIQHCATEEDEQKLIWYTTQLIRDAMCPLAEHKTLPQKFRTDTVIGLIRQMRRDEVWNFPILADALQDAGMDQEWDKYLEHCRSCSPFSFGSWIFRATGNLEFIKRKAPNDSAIDHPNPEV